MSSPLEVPTLEQEHPVFELLSGMDQVGQTSCLAGHCATRANTINKLAIMFSLLNKALTAVVHLYLSFYLALDGLHDCI